MMFDEIRKRWKDMPPAPWSFVDDLVNGRFRVPTGIKDAKGKWVIHPDHSFIYGCGAETLNAVKTRAEALKESPVDIEVLIRALAEACGNDAAKMEFLCNHAWKSLRQDLGLLPVETVFREKI